LRADAGSGFVFLELAGFSAFHPNGRTIVEGGEISPSFPDGLKLGNF
jgi:hypothetical protein